MASNCRHERHKIVRTHGKKSRGTLVCKDCKKAITHEEVKRKKRDEAQRRDRNY